MNFSIILLGGFIGFSSNAFEWVRECFDPSYHQYRITSAQTLANATALQNCIIQSSQRINVLKDMKDINNACMFLHKNQKQLDLEEFDFLPAKKLFHSNMTISQAQFLDDLKEVALFNSLLFGISISCHLYNYFKPIPFNLFWIAVTTTSLSTLYFIKLGYMYCRGTESEKCYNYLSEIESLQLKQSQQNKRKNIV